MSDRRGSNPQPSAWEADALPIAPLSRGARGFGHARLKALRDKERMRGNPRAGRLFPKQIITSRTRTCEASFLPLLRYSANIGIGDGGAAKHRHPNSLSRHGLVRGCAHRKRYYETHHIMKRTFGDGRGVEPRCAAYRTARESLGWYKSHI